jgi:hypothetical protein
MHGQSREVNKNRNCDGDTDWQEGVAIDLPSYCIMAF